ARRRPLAAHQCQSVGARPDGPGAGQRLRGPAARARRAATRAVPGDHRRRDHGRPAARAAHARAAAPPRLQAVDRRLRHRLLVAGVPQAARGRRAEDRQELRDGIGGRRRRRQDRALDHRVGAQPQPVGGGRGPGERAHLAAAGRARLRPGTGLLHRAPDARGPVRRLDRRLAGARRGDAAGFRLAAGGARLTRAPSLCGTGPRVRRFAAALGCALALQALGSAARADPGYYVVTVYDNAGQVNLDLRYWTVNLDNIPQVKWPELGLGYGVTSRWTTELYGSWIGSSQMPMQLNTWNWQNDLLLTQGDYPLDVALHTLLVRDARKADGYAIEWGPVLQTDVGRTQLNGNVFFEKGHDGFE